MGPVLDFVGPVGSLLHRMDPLYHLLGPFSDLLGPIQYRVGLVLDLVCLDLQTEWTFQVNLKTLATKAKPIMSSVKTTLKM